LKRSLKTNHVITSYRLLSKKYWHPLCELFCEKALIVLLAARYFWKDKLITFQIYTRRNVVSCLRPLNPVFDILVMPFLKTSFSTKAILEFLKKKGYDVTLSNDAGRFVCNYVYYHSLRLAEQRGSRSLFVHVPPFSRIDEETQMNFVASLLEAIASSC